MPAGYDPAVFAQQSSKLASNVDGIVRASVASTANPIIAYLTTISGALAITGFQLPSGFRGTFALRPTGAFTLATGGTYASDGTTDTIPIGLASTAVVGKILFITTDGLLCYPSY